MVKGGIHAEISELLRSRAFMRPSLRVPAVYYAVVLRMWQAGMVRLTEEVTARVGIFTVARPDDF